MPPRGERRRSGGISQRALLWVGVPFFLVACTFSYYGQLHRKQSADTWGTIYTSVALVEQRTIWLDDYFPLIQERAGERPYMVQEGPGGHVVTSTPTASSLLALPVVAGFSAAGVEAEDFNAWLEAGMLAGSITAALSVAVLFLVLLQLTTRGRAALIAATYAWGTLSWGTNGQALWQHAGVALALSITLWALINRRLALAGFAAGAMVAFRLPTAILVLCLLPLVGKRLVDWRRFALGVLPYAVALAAYNFVAFGSPLEQGYGSGHLTNWISINAGNLAEGVPGLLVSPGRGLFVYSPILLFALFGAVRGWGTPLYRWCAVAAAVYVVFAANSINWHGGESFGPRRLADILPLLAVLLVPALDAVWRTRWMWLYGALLGWSVFVQLLGTASWEVAAWYDERDLTADGTWWDPVDNELVAILQSAGLVPRLLAMLGILAAGLALGALATVTTRSLNRAIGDARRSRLDAHADEVRS